MRRLVAFLVLALAAVALAPAAASACSLSAQVPYTADAKVARAGAAIVGTVVAGSPRDGFTVISTVSVEQVVKGAIATSPVDVRHSTSEASCGFELPVGRRVGLTLMSDGSGTWRANEQFAPEDLGKDPDLDGLDAQDDNCPTVFNPGSDLLAAPGPGRDSDADGIGDACEGLGLPDARAPGVVFGTLDVPSVRRLRTAPWSVPLVSDEPGTALLELRVTLRGKRRLIASFAGDLPVGVTRFTLGLGVVERRMLAGRRQVTGRLVLRVRDAAGNARRVVRTVRFGPRA